MVRLVQRVYASACRDFSLTLTVQGRGSHGAKAAVAHTKFRPMAGAKIGLGSHKFSEVID